VAEEQFLQIENLDKILAALGPEIVGGPVRDMLTAICLRLEEDAKRGTPADNGRLRTSITHEVDNAIMPEWAVVGTNLEYAPFMEYGTGLFAEGDPAEKSGSGRHWPPGDALDVWAERHGWESGAAVAAAIGRRGGLEPRRFMRNALENNQGYIQEQVDKCGDEIGKLWSKADE